MEFWKNYYGYKNATSEAYEERLEFNFGEGEIVWGNACWDKNFYFIYFRELIIFQLFLYCYYCTYIHIYIFFRATDKKI